jgi:four helix bundle protein
MPPITRFEHLRAWQSSRRLANRIFDLSGAGQLARTYSIRDQIQRAAVSVMANIAEGFERNSAADFARFLLIAKASAAEVRSLVYLAADRQLLTVLERRELLNLANHTSGLIAKLRFTLLAAARNAPPRGRGTGDGAPVR